MPSAAGCCRSPARPREAASSRREAGAEEQHEDEHGVGRRVAVLRLAREGPAVGLADEDVGGAVGLAAGDEEDDVEHVEGPDRAEHDRRGQRRAEERQRDEAEALPARGAVDLGGLEHVLGNAVSAPIVTTIMNGKPSQTLVATLAVKAVENCANQAIGSQRPKTR